ncbi:hypothetical protein NMY22_g9552 [Coprinellus aureogranulatus]|nr:hypothetical protein NMY22_g9552 [Coprinellus aureogranulatus]
MTLRHNRALEVNRFHTTSILAVPHRTTSIQPSHRLRIPSKTSSPHIAHHGCIAHTRGGVECGVWQLWIRVDGNRPCARRRTLADDVIDDAYLHLLRPSNECARRPLSHVPAGNPYQISNLGLPISQDLNVPTLPSFSLTRFGLASVNAVGWSYRRSIDLTPHPGLLQSRSAQQVPLVVLVLGSMVDQESIQSVWMLCWATIVLLRSMGV